MRRFQLVRHNQPVQREETLSATDETPVKTNMKTLSVLIGAIIAGAVAWVTLRGDVSANTKRIDQVQDVSREMIAVKLDVASHTKQLDSIQAVQSADHDTIIELRASSREQTTLLKYLAEGRRGPVPATGGSGSGAP